jgi:tRNA modification GTPase
VNQEREKTIAAISTPVGTGAIAVIRMTGPDAIEIADRVFVSPRKKKAASCPAHKALYGWVQTIKGEQLDEVLLLVMRAPHTFTGEDTVEISCHGGMYICRRILEALLEAGASMAEPGEFSKRAFLHGRMDLTKAEAVMDMISAQTAYSLKAAVNQLGGGLYKKIEALRQSLLDMIVGIEVNIDYPEYEDVPEITDEAIQRGCLEINEEIKALLATAESGRMLRQGVKVSIVGRPNVGKSSLLNMLLREQRAIVTSVPGTTRDTLEERLDLAGIPICIMDTAGIRDTKDEVERIGVERALQSLEQCDLAFFVLDADREVLPEERQLFEKVKARPYLILLNKMDAGWQSAEQLEEVFPEAKGRILEVSAKQGSGVQALAARVKEMFFGGEVLADDRPMVTNLRQKEALIRAREALERVLEQAEFEQDLLVIDIRQACDFLGEVCGRSTQEDVVTEIFSRFCLGK